MRSTGISLSLSLLILVLATPNIHAVQMQVEGPQDSLLGAPTINHCTLRKAIINANDDAATYPQCQAGSGADEIVFNSNWTITTALAGINEDAGLTGDYDITSPLTIIGHPDGTILDGADLDRLFHINAAPGVVVTLRNLHIRNGHGHGAAGGILMSGGTLILENVTISGCSVFQGDGGAMVVAGGTTSLTNCTISGNTADHHAAAIVNDAGILNITNCTITGNASGFGNLTGGLRNLGTTTLRNTIVAGNGGVDLPNLDGTFTSLGYNIVGELGTMPGNPTIVAATGDQLDVVDATVNLGPLQNNGGGIATHELLPGSIAIDKGHSSGSSTDQRGLTRPCDDAGIANATGGDGGDAGAFEVQVACFANTPPTANPDNYTTDQDTTLNVPAPGVLVNDSDPEGPMNAVLVDDVSNGTLALNADGSFTYDPDPGFAGTDSFTYKVNDGDDDSNIVTVTIEVADTEPPSITASVATSLLWPPNHSLIDVGLSVSATDNSSDVTTSFAVFSDEPAGSSDDAVGTLQLRAERLGTGDGRVYLIIVSATDEFANTSHSCLTVVVPKSMSAKDVAAANAQAVAASTPCTGAAPAGFFPM